MSKRSTVAESAPQGLFPRLRAPQVPPAWGLADVGVLLSVLALAMLILASGVALVLTDANALPSVGTLRMGWLVGLLATLAYVWANFSRPLERLDALCLLRGLLPLPIVALWGVGAAFTIDLIAAAAGGGFAPLAELRELGNAPSDLIAAALLMLIVQPIAHGLVFTGVILPRLRAALKPWGGLLTTAALYAAYYALVYGALLPSGQSIAYGVLLPFVFGLFLCAMRIRTGSTTAAMVAHAAWGLAAFLVALALRA